MKKGQHNYVCGKKQNTVLSDEKEHLSACIKPRDLEVKISKTFFRKK